MSTPSGRYIHLTPEGWTADPDNGSLDVEKAYKQAKSQFMKTSGLSNKNSNDPLIFQKVAAVLQQKATLQGQLGQFIQQLDSLRRGDKAVHAKGITVEGFSTSLGKLAFAKLDGRKDKTIPNFVKALEKSLEPGGKSVQLASCIEEILNYIDSFGDFQGGQWFGKDKESGKLGSNAKLRVGGAKGATFVALKDCEHISNAYKRLSDIKDKAEGQQGGLTPQGLKQIVLDLKSVGYTFIRHFAGAVNEFTRVAEAQAVLNLPSNIKKFVESFNMTNVSFEVSQAGTKHVESASGTKRVSKGDTAIEMNYTINGKDGVWRTTISEKSGPLGVISKFNKNKEFSGNLVGGATYETIFDGLGWKIEKIFCNTYLHESVANDTELMSYLGARAASNIIAGTAGLGQALALRENNELIPIADLFDVILSNKSNMDRYINLRVKPLRPDGSVKSANQEVKADNSADDDGNKTAAQRRSSKVYQAIKDSVHFHANLGSRRGFGSLHKG